MSAKGHRVPNPPRGFHASGYYTCPCLSVPVAAETVRTWLPDKLELAPQTLTAEGTHPITLLMGEERDVYPSPPRWPRLGYQEFAVVVPFVRWREPAGYYPGPFLFTPHLFIDKRLPIALGRYLFGFAKARARMRFNLEGVRIEDPVDGAPLFEARFEVHEREPGLAARRTIERLLQQPSISEQRPGRFVCSGFNWNLDAARVRPMTARVKAFQPFLPGLDEVLPREEVRGMEDLASGFAYVLETRWTLTPPRSPALDWSAYDTAGGLEQGAR